MVFLHSALFTKEDFLKILFRPQHNVFFLITGLYKKSTIQHFHITCTSFFSRCNNDAVKHDLDCIPFQTQRLKVGNHHPDTVTAEHRTYLGADLVAALSGLEVHNLPHVDGAVILGVSVGYPAAILRLSCVYPVGILRVSCGILPVCTGECRA